MIVYRKNSKNNVIVVTEETEQDGFVRNEYFWVKLTPKKFAEVKVDDEIDVPAEFLQELP